MNERSTPALEIVDAAVSYRGVRAIDGVDLRVSGSEIVALVGPSGCGKTTLLRAVAGLVGLDHGSIRVNGELVDDGHRRLPPERRRIGLVFQEHSLFPHLTVLDNVTFGIRDAAKADTVARGRAALDVVELAGHADRYPHELSGGERQRVALARALAPRPALMLFDEPFASLDPNLRVQLRRDVIGALRSTGTPAVFVTHDQHEALAIGDRIAVLRAGRLQQVASPSAVFHAPANRFVAAFMGDASFLPVVDSPAGRSTVFGPLATERGHDATVAMVRPDDVTFVDDPAGDAHVEAVEFRGSVWSCSIVLADGCRVTAQRSHLDPPTVGAVGRAELVPGHRPVPVADP